VGGGPRHHTARRARYAYLEDVRRKHKAEKIITAHHQDDLIETALLNLLRGSGRRGLTAIIDNEKVRRPLIMIPKKEILKYAKANGLDWREDVTNSDGRPLRNHLRLKVLPKLSPEDRRAFLAALEKTAGLNADINREIAALSLKIEQDDSIDRQLFSLLPAKVADELLTHWLRNKNLGEIDRYEVSRLSLALKTAKPGSAHPVKGASKLMIETRTAGFRTTP
jgi:tRNA(Ile)-lysidine synthase TilS/MesJ